MARPLRIQAMIAEKSKPHARSWPRRVWATDGSNIGSAHRRPTHAGITPVNHPPARLCILKSRGNGSPTERHRREEEPIIKDVMLCLEGIEADEVRVGAAETIAGLFDSHVIGLFLNTVPSMIRST